MAKCRIYEPTVPYHPDKYNLIFIDIIGLMIEARGTITQFFADFCKKFELQSAFATDISLDAIKGSPAILKNHL